MIENAEAILRACDKLQDWLDVEAGGCFPSINGHEGFYPYFRELESAFEPASGESQEEKRAVILLAGVACKLKVEADSTARTISAESRDSFRRAKMRLRLVLGESANPHTDHAQPELIAIQSPDHEVIEVHLKPTLLLILGYLHDSVAVLRKRAEIAEHAFCSVDTVTDCLKTLEAYVERPGGDRSGVRLNQDGHALAIKYQSHIQEARDKAPKPILPLSHTNSA